LHGDISEHFMAIEVHEKYLVRVFVQGHSKSKAIAGLPKVVCLELTNYTRVKLPRKAVLPYKLEQTHAHSPLAAAACDLFACSQRSSQQQSWKTVLACWLAGLPHKPSLCL
jgi:hypothetical protein